MVPCVRDNSQGKDDLPIRQHDWFRFDPPIGILLLRESRWDLGTTEAIRDDSNRKIHIRYIIKRRTGVPRTWNPKEFPILVVAELMGEGA